MSLFETMSDDTNNTQSTGETQIASLPVPEMPVGCVCGFEWYRRGSPEWFRWNYQTVCPVKPEDHTAVWRPYFRHILASGSGGGQAPGGAQIMINDGSVSSYPFALDLTIVR